MPQQVEGEISLSAATDQLRAAVGALVDPVKAFVNGQVRVAPSLFDQLRSETAASSQGLASRQGHAKSSPPIWIDAVTLLGEIGDAVGAWSPAGTTADRLRELAGRRWRPQDVHGILQIIAACKGWQLNIEALLDPGSVKTISAPCPACGSKTVYRRNGSGEMVRQPALRLITEVGCTCQSCRAHWSPSLYMHLCRLLGFKSPAGVLG